MSDEQRHHRGISAWAQFATLSAALLGWMFDGFEMGVFFSAGWATRLDESVPCRSVLLPTRC